MLNHQEQRVIHDLKLFEEPRILLQAFNKLLQFAFFDSYDAFRIVKLVLMSVIELDSFQYSIQVTIIDILERFICLNGLKEVCFTASLTQLDLCSLICNISDIPCNATTFQIKSEHAVAPRRRLVSVLHYHHV